MFISFNPPRREAAVYHLHYIDEETEALGVWVTAGRCRAHMSHSVPPRFPVRPLGYLQQGRGVLGLKVGGEQSQGGIGISGHSESG